MVTAVDQVWATDITYIPMQKGFLYLVAIVDLFSRNVLSWKLSNSLDTEFCLDALEMALEGGRKSEIFHSDQGCQPGFKGLSQHPFFRGLTSDDEQTPKTDGAAGSTRVDAFAG
jgi:transposase InsO family protein